MKNKPKTPLPKEIEIIKSYGFIKSGDIDLNIGYSNLIIDKINELVTSFNTLTRWLEEQ